MKIKAGIAAGILATSIILPMQVMAQSTDDNSTQCGFICRIQRVFRRDVSKSNNPEASSMPTPSGSGAPGIMASPKIKLDQAVQNGKITQVQADEILSRLTAIKTKQQELNDLEKSLSEYMKTNNLPAELLGKKPAGGPMQSPQSSPSIETEVVE